MFLFFVTHIVFSLESKTFLTKPQWQKAGFYREKKPEKHNNSWHSRFNSHFKVFLISTLPFSYKHHNQNTFVCFDFQNSTTPKHEKISLQPAEVTSMLQLSFLYQDHPAFANFLESTEYLAVGICPKSVPGGGKPKTDACHGHLWLKERISSYATGTHHTAVCPWSRFQKGKGWQSSWTAYAWNLCCFIWKETHLGWVWIVWLCSVFRRPELSLPSAGKQWVSCGLNSGMAVTFLTPWRSRLLLSQTCETCDFSTD